MIKNSWTCMSIYIILWDASTIYENIICKGITLLIFLKIWRTALAKYCKFGLRHEFSSDILPTWFTLHFCVTVLYSLKISLTHCMPLFSFCTHWKYEKIRGFVMFSINNLKQFLPVICNEWANRPTQVKYIVSPKIRNRPKELVFTILMSRTKVMNIQQNSFHLSKLLYN